MDKECVKNSLNFHGQQLSKVWETERSAGELEKLGIEEVDYSVYLGRKLSLQDRSKRLKLHQFIAQKAAELFDSDLLKCKRSALKLEGEQDGEYYACLPPYELFLRLDKSQRLVHFFRCVQPEELLICIVTSKNLVGVCLKVLCSDGVTQRFVADLNVKAFLPTSGMPQGSVVYDKKNQPRQIMQQDVVRVKVVEVGRDSEKLMVTMLDEDPQPGLALGLIFTDDLPESYKPLTNMKSWLLDWNQNPDKMIE